MPTSKHGHKWGCCTNAHQNIARAVNSHAREGTKLAVAVTKGSPLAEHRAVTGSQAPDLLGVAAVDSRRRICVVHAKHQQPAESCRWSAQGRVSLNVLLTNRT